MAADDAALQHLLDQVAGGDASALATLYDRTAARLHGVLVRLVRCEADAEELLVDVFQQVWDQAGRYNAARGRPLSWLAVIARSRALDCLRRREARRRHERPLVEQAVRVEQGDPADDPARRREDAEREDEAKRALSALPGDQRRTLELAYFDGLSHTAIARQLDVPLGTVKTRIRRGLRTLRQALAEATETS